MFRHTVLFRWTADTTADHVAVIATGLRGLPAVIPEIVTYRCGSDLGLTEGNFDFVVVADFADRAGWIAYRDNATHQAIIAEHIRDHIAERAAVQWETDAA